ncbi:hypothetical protein EDC94DRAFT_592665 [Helicostylum pulchrum]|nr:hypothetical protein EDC94DRAFT_592665 [Helicostylum pulchrum]
MEKAMNSLSGPTAELVKEAVRRQEEQQQQLQQQQQQQQTSVTADLAINAEDRYMMNEFGSPSYIQEYYQQESSQSSTSSPKSIDSQQDEIEIQNHLKFYLIQIQPYFPLFVPSHFNRQYTAHELPKILIYSMCALSCLFQQMEEHFSYYQRAMMILDEWIGRPSISLVQTLLILIKYKEYSTTANYFSDTKSLITRTIEMCKILNLEQITTANSNDPSVTETRKRTYCMVYTYNTLLSVEQGMMNELSLTKEHLPSTVTDESTVDCQRFIIQFSNTLNQIHQHMLRMNQRQEVQKDLRNENQIIEENMSIFQLQVKIENDLIQLPSNLTINNHHHQYAYKNTPSFPAQDIIVTVSPMTRLLHMLYHLNIILLHHHYSKYPLPVTAQIFTTYPHGELSSHSASSMIRLVEGLIQDPSQSYRYSPRGIQFINHCLSTAFTVLRFDTHNSTKKAHLDEFQRCAHLLQRVSSASPSNEMRSYARELDLSAINLDVSSLKVSCTTTPSTSPSPTTESMKPRRNTISHRPNVPPSLLQLSSTGVSQQFTLHHPLHNIHAAPLSVQQPQQSQPQQTQQPHYPILRGSTQSCNDLRSMNRLHKVSPPPPPPPITTQFTSNSFTQHRKPVGSVISSSTTGSSQGPYRASSVRNVSPSLPYVKPYDNTPPPTMTQSSGYPRQPSSSSTVGKMKRIKKSVSIQGISNAYRVQHQQQQQQHQQQEQFHLYQQQQQQLQLQQQMANYLGNQNMLHRPYQPTFDDKYMTDQDFSIDVDELNFLSNYPPMDDQQQRSEGHQLL